MRYILLFLAFFSFRLCAQKVVSIAIDGSINPVSADFIKRGLKEAENSRAECLLIHLNTPGGLVKSTRVIVSNILEAKVPVVVFVSPSGAQAGSAGVFITLAAHVAAMAPGTNIGAAHPVNMQGQRDTIMNEKATNDAAAFIRSIAEKRKRNLQWADQAVRKSISITENEAVKNKVIDLISRNTTELLNKIDGRKIELSYGSKTLHTKKATIVTYEMSVVEKFLDQLSDPNIAYVLFLLGLYGVLFELYSPGAILPGIIGGICLIVAFYSMHTLPINYAGLALIAFAIILFLLEVKIVSHGILSIGGVISLFLGSLMLIRSDSFLESVRISWGVIIAACAITAFFFLFIIGLGLKAQRSKPLTGIEGLLGDTGESLDTLDPFGSVRVHGEIWQAQSLDGKINKGEKIKVVGLNNLELEVKHA